MTPTRINLIKDKQLEMEWPDGRRGIYSLSYLRSMCPCAQCKIVREGANRPVTKSKSLTILPGNYATALTAVSAEMVGNYAIRIDWSDDHASGIYSFQYLREICPP